MVPEKPKEAYKEWERVMGELAGTGYGGPLHD